MTKAALFRDHTNYTKAPWLKNVMLPLLSCPTIFSPKLSLQQNIQQWVKELARWIECRERNYFVICVESADFRNDVASGVFATKEAKFCSATRGKVAKIDPPTANPLLRSSDAGLREYGALRQDAQYVERNAVIDLAPGDLQWAILMRACRFVSTFPDSTNCLPRASARPRPPRPLLVTLPPSSAPPHPRSRPPPRPRQRRKTSPRSSSQSKRKPPLRVRLPTPPPTAKAMRSFADSIYDEIVEYPSNPPSPPSIHIDVEALAEEPPIVVKGPSPLPASLPPVPDAIKSSTPLPPVVIKSSTQSEPDAIKGSTPLPPVPIVIKRSTPLAPVVIKASTSLPSSAIKCSTPLHLIEDKPPIKEQIQSQEKHVPAAIVEEDSQEDWSSEDYSDTDELMVVPIGIAPVPESDYDYDLLDEYGLEEEEDSYGL